MKTLCLGRIQAAVWENEGDQKFYSVTFARPYADEAGKYHDTDSFGRDDLLLVAKLAENQTERVTLASGRAAGDPGRSFFIRGSKLKRSSFSKLQGRPNKCQRALPPKFEAL